MKGLADVISLDAYRVFKKVIKIRTDKHCKRPFHLKRYVVINRADHHNMCAACGVNVSIVHHPSMKNPRWYG